jgi:hypothetical protein
MLFILVKHIKKCGRSQGTARNCFATYAFMGKKGARFEEQLPPERFSRSNG